MPGSSPTEAFGNFVEPLRRALTCVSGVAQLIGSGKEPETEHSLVLRPASQIELAGNPPILLELLHQYELTSDKNASRAVRWKVRTTAYNYAIYAADGSELIGYHYHPSSTSRVKYAHIHVYNAPGVIAERHFPTGRVAMEDVIRLAIEDFEVTAARADWEKVLDETQRIFEGYRLWHGSRGYISPLMAKR